MSISWFIDRLKEYEDREAIIYNDKIFLYKDILNNYDELKGIIKESEIKEGEAIAVEGDYSPKMIAIILALIENRNIVVPLTSVTKLQQEEFFEIAYVDKFYKVDDYDNKFKTLRYNNDDKNELIKKLNSLNEPGLVLFTSGSTGKPKGVIHNFTKLLEKYKLRRQALRTITFLLLDHIGGINTLFHTLGNGGTIIALKSRKPEDVCKAVQDYKVELLPASPTFLNLLLLSEQYKKYDFLSLKIISYGTEVMPESILKRLNKVFSGVKFKQTYGLSELGIMRAKSKSSDSLWVKVGGEGFETKIVDGILHIRADSAMLGYLNAPSPFDEEGWLNTQDQENI